MFPTDSPQPQQNTSILLMDTRKPHSRFSKNESEVYGSYTEHMLHLQMCPSLYRPRLILFFVPYLKGTLHRRVQRIEKKNNKTYILELFYTK